MAPVELTQNKIYPRKFVYFEKRTASFNIFILKLFFKSFCFAKKLLTNYDKNRKRPRWP